MTPFPLYKIGFGWRSHKMARRWVGMILDQEPEAYGRLSRSQATITGLKLYMHAMPYVLIICILGRLLFFEVLELLSAPSGDWISYILLWHMSEMFWWIAVGAVVEIVIGLTVISIRESSRVLDIGIVVGIAASIPAVIASGIGPAIIFWIKSGIGFGMGIGGFWGVVASIVFFVVTAVLILFATVIAFMFVMLGLFLLACILLALMWTLLALFAMPFVLREYPVHLRLVWPRLRPDRYGDHPVAKRHSVAADFVPFIGLDRLLVAYAELNPGGEDEIERLINKKVHAQKQQALRAKTIWISRKASRISDLSKLSEVVAQLPEDNSRDGKERQQLLEWVDEISGLQTNLNTIDRPIHREPNAQLLCEKIENFRLRIAELHKPLATEFRVAAEQWLQIAQRQLDETRRITGKKSLPRVFRAGGQINREENAFVERNTVVGELEQQVMMGTGCPGIVLYGRRRMGKSTILYNLPGFLPPNVITTFVSMQKPQMFTSVESAVGFLHDEIRRRMPSLPATEEVPVDLSSFFRFLTDCNARLEAENKRLLLALDEYEKIDEKIGEGVFSRNLLDTIRESIQTHRRITWIFVGSHEITELTNAPWTSYLVSTRTIEVPAFTLAETRLLLTEPLKHSNVWKDNEAKRPRIRASSWGEGGIERIHTEAGGWPELVQLITETITNIINDEEASEVSLELMERALDKSIVLGQNTFLELMKNESKLPGEWDYLLAFKKAETQPPPEDEKIAFSLRQRKLIEESNGEWRLRVPLMARWLKQRGQ